MNFGAGPVAEPTAKQGPLSSTPDNAEYPSDNDQALQNALRRAMLAEAAAAKSMAVLRQAEQLLQRLQAERVQALARARTADQRAAEAELGLRQLRELTEADRVELEAAILRASEAMAEIEDARRRAEDAEWRAVRAEARIEQLLKATQGQAPERQS